METAVKLDDAIESQALAIPDRARSILVTDNNSMEQANAFKLDIKAMIKEIDEFFKPLADKAFQSHRAITGKWNETKAPLKEADDHVTAQVKAYLRKVREEEEREAARLREIARKEEEERRLAQAAELEQEGAIDEANALLEEPITYVAPVPVMDVPKVDNRLYRVQTKVKVTDRKAFLMNVPFATLLEVLPESAWTGIETGLSRKAKALGKAFSMKGCEVYEV